MIYSFANNLSIDHYKLANLTETEELADLTSTELQAQLDALGKELEQRHAKKQRYKQLLIEEKEKCAIVKAHYQEELVLKQKELDRAVQSHRDHQEEHRMIVKSLRVCQLSILSFRFLIPS